MLVCSAPEALDSNASIKKDRAYEIGNYEVISTDIGVEYRVNTAYRHMRTRVEAVARDRSAHDSADRVPTAWYRIEAATAEGLAASS